MVSAAIDRRGRADDDPRLRAAEQLVGGSADEVGPRRDRASQHRLVAERLDRSRAEVVDDRDAALAAERAELLQGGLLGEADRPEVRLVDPQDRSRRRSDGGDVIADPGPVGGPDLDQRGPRLGKDLGDPEGAADLDQLTAARDHLAAGGESGQGEQHARPRCC